MDWPLDIQAVLQEHYRRIAWCYCWCDDLGNGGVDVCDIFGGDYDEIERSQTLLGNVGD